MINYDSFYDINSMLSENNNNNFWFITKFMNIFLFHRDLRLFDNTSLIAQVIKRKTVTPIFIFPPQQIKPEKNPYFSNNSVQFMIETLKELESNFKQYNSKLYYFQGQNLQVLKSINKLKKIKSIYFNYDYTPYAKKRDQEIKDWGQSEHIQVISLEDYVLYDILNGSNLAPKTQKPYLVFTPFKNHCLTNLKVRKPNNFQFKNENFVQYEALQHTQYSLKNQLINKFYVNNNEVMVHGGRTNALSILKRIKEFKSYNEDRNFPIKSNTKLSAYLHFTPVSIRQVYHNVLSQLGINNNLINQLHWRDFYVNISHHFPHVLGKQNTSFQKKFDQVKWKYNEKHMKAWKQGQTGFPIVDAGMREMNETGYMHNRCRMIVACFFSKDLFLDWHEGQRYFASKLVDYSPMQNSGGWQWTVGNGTDAQPYFRIFNPWTQQLNYDENCLYIKKWIPQLKNVPNQDIHKWNIKCDEYIKKGVKYPKPIVDHQKARKQTLQIYNSYFKKQQK